MITVVCDDPTEFDDVNKLIRCALSSGFRVNTEFSVDKAFYNEKAKEYFDEHYPNITKEKRTLVVDIAAETLTHLDDAINKDTIAATCEMVINDH